MSKSIATSHIVLDCAGELFRLAQAHVQAIEPASTITPLPVNSPGLEGLVLLQNRLVPLMTLSKRIALDHENSYVLLISTSRGDVGLCINGLQDASAFDQSNSLPDAHDLLENLLATYACSNQHVKDSNEWIGVEAAQRQTCLLVQADGEVQAFSMAPNMQVARADHVRALTSESPGQCIVRLENHLWPGRYLSSQGNLSEHTNRASKGSWCVLWNDGLNPEALVVDDVLGLHELTSGQLHSWLDHGQRREWFYHAEYGEVPLRSLLGPSKHTTDDRLSEPNVSPARSLAQNTLASEAMAGILLQAGNVRVVLPLDCLVKVVGQSECPEVQDQGHPDAVPVLLWQDIWLSDTEASNLTHVAPPPETARFWVLCRLSEQTVAIASDSVEPEVSHHPWHPLPLLPPSMGGIFTAARLADGMAHFLLDPQASRLRDFPAKHWLMTH